LSGGLRAGPAGMSRRELPPSPERARERKSIPCLPPDRQCAKHGEPQTLPDRHCSTRLPRLTVTPADGQAGRRRGRGSAVGDSLDDVATDQWTRPVPVCSTRAHTSRHGGTRAGTPRHELPSDLGFWDTGRHAAASRGTAEWVYKTDALPIASGCRSELTATESRPPQQFLQQTLWAGPSMGATGSTASSRLLDLAGVAPDRRPDPGRSHRIGPLLRRVRAAIAERVPVPGLHRP
jgi:hypothetical protein